MDLFVLCVFLCVSLMFSFVCVSISMPSPYTVRCVR